MPIIRSTICNWPTNQFFLETLPNASILFNKALEVLKRQRPWQSKPPTCCSCKPKEVISAHHYPALLIIIPSCLWPDPNCPSTMNIIKCEPRCTVISPLIPPHQETKTRNKQKEFGPFVSFPLYHWHGGFEAYRSGSESDWACSVRLVLQDWVAQITPHDPFVGVFINPMYSASIFGFANEQRGHG